MQEKVLIVDFGSQYTQLIARRVRELFIFSEICPFDNLPNNIFNYKAIILSGSPSSVRTKDAPAINLDKIRGKIPILAVCYGAQYLAHNFGGKVSPSKIREYGRAKLSFVKADEVFFDLIEKGSQVWMSHSDTINKLPDNSTCIASTFDVQNAAFKINNEVTYGIQFHPEVYHTFDGKKILSNFLVKIAKVLQNWTPKSFVEKSILKIKKTVGNDKVILGLSGGVDSTVSAILLNKAIGKNLTCIFINNGLLRKNEFNEVLNQYKNMDLNVKGIESSALFLKKLSGIEDPERKRKIIGNTFIDVFDEESNLIEGVKWLAQGTIYPDVIESISVKGPSSTIKSHHNVGGLPSFMKLKIIEPLKMLFKDEVRKIG